MARRWRLRNKLLLGLGLVVCCVGALIAGTAYGLTSYMGTMKTTDSKLAELLTLDELKPAVAAILSDPAASPAKPVQAEPAIELNTDARTGEVRRARQKLDVAKGVFSQYKVLFAETVRRQRDPDPYQDSQLVGVIDKTFSALEAAIDQFASPQASPISKPLAADEAVHKQHQLLLKAIDDLRNEVAKDMYDRIGQARNEYRRSIAIVVAATAVALLLVGTLVSLFSGWVFKPIRDLQAGVRRVTEGDFTQPIDLASGDELEDLAVAFNEMTARLHQVYRDLEHQVDERSRQLVRSERMVSVGFLAAGVAHEINNPLASIAFCSEALQTRLSDYLTRNPHETDVVQKYLRMIQQEAFRCKGITSRLLEFSRIGERRREPTDLAELVQGVLEIAQHLQHCRGKRIIFQPYSRVTAGVCRGGHQVSRAQSRCQRAGEHGGGRGADHHPESRRSDGGNDVHGHRVRYGPGRSGQHLRAVLYAKPDRQGDRARAVHQPPHCGPARRRNPGDERRTRAGEHIHGAGAAHACTGPGRPPGGPAIRQGPEAGRDSDGGRNWPRRLTAFASCLWTTKSRCRNS